MNYEYRPVIIFITRPLDYFIKGNQLLLEYDMGFIPQPGEEENRVDVGSVALGYDVAIDNSVELIN